jgi:hypothetical protein
VNAASPSAPVATNEHRTSPLVEKGCRPDTASLVVLTPKLGHYSEASFAHLCAAAPIPASSGRTSRHRLNHGGNRQANRAMHITVIVRLRYCPRTRAYKERHVHERRTKQEVIRCRKRYVERDVYRTRRADFSDLALRG